MGKLTSRVVQGNALLTKMKEAMMQKHDQYAALQELEAALPPEKVSEWTGEVEAWKLNHQEASNPYCCKQEAGERASIFPYPF